MGGCLQRGREQDQLFSPSLSRILSVRLLVLDFLAADSDFRVEDRLVQPAIHRLCWLLHGLAIPANELSTSMSP